MVILSVGNVEGVVQQARKELTFEINVHILKEHVQLMKVRLVWWAIQRIVKRFAINKEVEVIIFLRRLLDWTG